MYLCIDDYGKINKNRTCELVLTNDPKSWNSLPHESKTAFSLNIIKK